MQEGRETTAEANKAKKLSKDEELASGENNKQMLERTNTESS